MKKYCAIEYLRVWFLILIIMTHSVMGDMLVWGRILHTMGSRVDIFMLICGFFLFVSLKKTDMTLWKRIKHRCIRILPVLILYKTLAMLFKVGHGGNFLSNIFMLNQNIGIHIPTMTHIIWYVDVMFWVYLFYVTLFDIVQRKTALFITTIIMIMSLVVLFGNDNINLHFEMAAPFLDGGVLRGLAFIGMGILIAAIPKINIGSKIFNKLMITGVECLSAYNVMFYTTLYHHITPVGAFNHVLWGGVFIYLWYLRRGICPNG